jgi:hypothetical protein
MLGSKLKQQIKDLKNQHESLEWEIAEVYNSNADPDMIMVYLGELQCMQIAVEEEIDALEHELGMLPLKLMLGGFIIFATSLLIYVLINS